MDWLRQVREAFLPDTASIARYTETSTSDGVYEDWVEIATGVRCAVQPHASRGLEAVGAGDAIRSVSPWMVTVPFGTDVTVRDRITVTGADRPDGRTFEISRVDERSYEAGRDCQCELVQ
jgi:hypothetical protein